MYLKFLFPFLHQGGTVFNVYDKSRKQKGLNKIVLTKYSSLLLEPPKCFNFICVKPSSHPASPPTLSTSGEGALETDLITKIEQVLKLLSNGHEET